ncbi:MAG: restriction endonuclease subunit S [Planctomycetaceae bacterium]|jgi:hypothetical protein|nr:restriction endonuclease subunit S [Planctomycetaceae bacterium]
MVLYLKLLEIECTLLAFINLTNVPSSLFKNFLPNSFLLFWRAEKVVGCLFAVDNFLSDQVQSFQNAKSLGGNKITVSYNGSVGWAFYQPTDFLACDDVNVLEPRFNLNRYIAIFITTLIEQEQYR